MRRVLPRIVLNPAQLDVAPRTKLMKTFGEESTQLNQGLLSAADISRVAVLQRKIKYNLLGEYCTTVSASLRAPIARALAAELTASLSALVSSRYLQPNDGQRSVLVVCRDPMEAMDDVSVAGQHGRRRSLRGRRGAVGSDESSSMLNSRGELVSVWRLPDPRHALRELRSNEVTAERTADALEAQACALAELSQLIPLMEVAAFLNTQPGKAVSGGTLSVEEADCLYPPPPTLPHSLGQVHARNEAAVCQELLHMETEMAGMFPCIPNGGAKVRTFV